MNTATTVEVAPLESTTVCGADRAYIMQSRVTGMFGTGPDGTCSMSTYNGPAGRLGSFPIASGIETKPLAEAGSATLGSGDEGRLSPSMSGLVPTSRCHRRNR